MHFHIRVFFKKCISQKYTCLKNFLKTTTLQFKQPDKARCCSSKRSSLLYLGGERRCSFARNNVCWSLVEHISVLLAEVRDAGGEKVRVNDLQGRYRMFLIFSNVPLDILCLALFRPLLFVCLLLNQNHQDQDTRRCTPYHFVCGTYAHITAGPCLLGFSPFSLSGSWQDHLKGCQLLAFAPQLHWQVLSLKF